MEGTTTSVASALTSGLTDAANSAIEVIIAVIPPAVLVLGAMFGISAGIRAFKKIGGR